MCSATQVQRPQHPLAENLIPSLPNVPGARQTAAPPDPTAGSRSPARACMRIYVHNRALWLINNTMYIIVIKGLIEAIAQYAGRAVQKVVPKIHRW